MRWGECIIVCAACGALAFGGCTGLPLGKPPEPPLAADATSRARSPHGPSHDSGMSSPEEAPKMAAHAPPRIRRLPPASWDNPSAPGPGQFPYPASMGSYPNTPYGQIQQVAWTAPTQPAAAGDPVDVLLASMRGREGVDPQEVARLESRLRELLREEAQRELAPAAAAGLDSKVEDETSDKKAPAEEVAAAASAAETPPTESATTGQDTAVKSDEAGEAKPAPESAVVAENSLASDASSQAPAPQEAPPEGDAALAPQEPHVASRPAGVTAEPAAFALASQSGPANPLPVEPLRSRSWRDLLAEAIDALERELAENDTGEPPADEPSRFEPPSSPRSAARQARSRERACQEITLRLMQLLAGRKDDALRPIQSLDGREQEYWKHQLHGLTVLLDQHGTPVDDHRWRLALRSFREAMHYLAVGSSLEVRSLAFCTRVDSYGRFEEFERYEFRAGQEVLLYVEVDNFTVEQTPEGHLTEMQASYRISNVQGHRVAEDGWPPEREVCRNRRRDFFVPYRLYLPQRIYPGRYTLTLTVEDMRGNKFGQGSINFTVVP